MVSSTVGGDLRVQGNLVVGGTRQETARTGLEQDQLAAYAIPWEAWRVHDAYQTTLPGTSLADDLGLVGGTFGTGVPSIQTEDLKAAGATTSYARCVITIPPEYDTSETAVLRFRAGMLTTISDGTATLDVEAFESDFEAAKSGSDLVSTTVQDINSVTLADTDFAITTTTLSPGDTIDIRIAIAINDTSTVTVVKGIVGSAFLLLDIRG